MGAMLVGARGVGCVIVHKCWNSTIRFKMYQHPLFHNNKSCYQSMVYVLNC